MQYVSISYTTKILRHLPLHVQDGIIKFSAAELSELNSDDLLMQPELHVL